MRCLTSGFAGSVSNFEKQADQLLKSVNEHDYDLLGTYGSIPGLVGLRHESCSWSVFMVIDHLRLHTEFLLNSMRSLIVANELTAPSPAVQYWRPEDAGADCLDHFQDSVWQYVAFANNLVESGQHRHPTGAIRHPQYGLLNVKRLSVYGCHHLGLHRRQIQAILASIGVA